MFCAHFFADQEAAFGRPMASATTTASSKPLLLTAFGSSCLRMLTLTSGFAAPMQ